MDIRPRRLAEEILFPSGKEGSRPHSLSFLRLALADKSRSVLLATFPKSGCNWTGDILDYCVIRKFTGSYSLTFEGEGTIKDRQRKPMIIFTPANACSAGRRRVSEMIPGISGLDYAFHTHGHWGDSPLWGLNSARTVFITRNIPTSLFSYFKARQPTYGYRCFEDFLADGPLERSILFHNSWGTFKRLPSAQFRVFHYEDMRREPMAVFPKIYQYIFQQDIEPEILAEALDFFSFERQKKREFDLGIDEALHFHYKGKASYEDEIAPDTLNMIRSRLCSELTDTFGYDYSSG